MSDGQHPALASAIAAGAFGNTDATMTGPDEDFEHGLEFILDGIETLAKRHPAPHKRTTVSGVGRAAQRSNPQ